MDMFYISSFLRYLKKEFPFLEISVKYNPVGLYMTIQIKHTKSYNYFLGDFTAEDEKDATNKISQCVTEFLSKVVE